MTQSVYALFQNTAQRLADRPAARFKEAGVWHDVTWKELKSLGDRLAGGLIATGVQPKDRVAIMANSRLEWTAADLGILGAGAATVPIYQSNLADDVAYILNDSGCVLVFAEDKQQMEKMRRIRADVPAVKRVVCMEDAGATPGDPWEVSWTTFLAEGASHLQSHPTAVDERAGGLTPEDVLTLIYTAGTTGKPKGTILVHDCMLYEAEAIQNVNLLTPDDVQYLFLPLAHVFAKVLQTTWFATGHVMAFWERDQSKIIDNLSEVHPTIMAAVPRIYEKIHGKVTSDAHATPGLQGKLARWALGLGEKAARTEMAGGTPGGLGWKVAQKVVFKKIGAKLATRVGGNLRFFVSGGAPLGKDIAYFFKYANVKICEGYGLTETSAASSVNLPEDIRIGTVGRPIPGTEMKIAPDGEILIRGRGVMRGYWNRPDATAEAIDADKWFHTGDIGEIDKDGFVRITDRKKDIIVTAGGKNVAPQNIEGALKSKSPLISQVVVHGDQRKYLTALLTVDPDALKAWATARGLVNGAFDFKVVSQNPALRAEIEGVVGELNKNLASYEALKKVHILDHDFEIGDQLTPKLSVKRKLCNERYKAFFDAMY